MSFTPAPFGLVGIVNLTPDSFCDGGRFDGVEAALAHALALARAGADVLDLGAESTRPGATGTSAAEEWRRLQPVLRALAAQWHGGHFGEETGVHGGEAAPPPPLLSVDTWRADTARKALALGAHIVNDVSACALDPDLTTVLADVKPGYVLTHSAAHQAGGSRDVRTLHTHPRYTAIMDVLRDFFATRLAALTRAGLPEEHVVLDPGIGFGKNGRETLEIFRQVHLLREFGRPLLVGLSMKSCFNELLGLASPQERGLVTQVATALLAERGVALHRVHDVAAAGQALRLGALFACPPSA